MALAKEAFVFSSLGYQGGKTKQTSGSFLQSSATYMMNHLPLM